MEGDANVAAGLRHDIDVDEDEQITRDGYDKRAESRVCCRAGCRNKVEGIPFIYPELGGGSAGRVSALRIVNHQDPKRNVAQDNV